MINTSLAGQFWGGFCPVCLVPKSDMRLNSNDEWECPICHLQISVGDKVVVLPHQGIGSFMRRHHRFFIPASKFPIPIGIIAQDLRC